LLNLISDDYSAASATPKAIDFDLSSIADVYDIKICHEFRQAAAKTSTYAARREDAGA